MLLLHRYFDLCSMFLQVSPANKLMLGGGGVDGGNSDESCLLQFSTKSIAIAYLCVTYAIESMTNLKSNGKYNNICDSDT